jgi:hypothetical protein
MRLTRLLPLSLAALLAACAGLQESTSTTPVLAYTLGENRELLRIDTRAPQTVLARQALTGLQHHDQLVGLSRRASDGQLFALSRSGQLYQVDAATGAATVVGTGSAPPGTPTFGAGTGISGVVFSGEFFGTHFDPSGSYLRVVTDRGMNLRLDPQTSLAIDGDPALFGRQPDAALHYAADDAQAGKAPAVVALAVTGEGQDAVSYGIDRELGNLVRLGSNRAGTAAASPDAGVLHTVGSLGLGRLRDASLDIDAKTQKAYAVIRTASDLRTRLFTIDLQSGKARAVGVVEQGRPVQGLAIAP